jgi:hypothetical protein
MGIADDLAPFFSLDEFAVEAVLDGVPVVGIYDAPYAEAFGMATTAPVFRLPDANLCASQASSLTIKTGPGAGLWRVRSIEPDGTGVTALSLERAT